ncbi:hypothetical protein B0T18DRAFT_491927 [Schizothecium vesticola]|uniref:Uncharacterized protein n=1 Tax=Schizothecium vesticola TaxID=314040 RepID=A0AA40BP00_9PEZI|nr:hypothetical protein B0T18DRAFT_491927 [Schizothecium vesticola]
MAPARFVVYFTLRIFMTDMFGHPEKDQAVRAWTNHRGGGHGAILHTMAILEHHDGRDDQVPSSYAIRVTSNIKAALYKNINSAMAMRTMMDPEVAQATNQRVNSWLSFCYRIIELFDILVGRPGPCQFLIGQAVERIAVVYPEDTESLRIEMSAPPPAHTSSLTTFGSIGESLCTSTPRNPVHGCILIKLGTARVFAIEGISTELSHLFAWQIILVKNESEENTDSDIDYFNERGGVQDYIDSMLGHANHWDATNSDKLFC